MSLHTDSCSYVCGPVCPLWVAVKTFGKRGFRWVSSPKLFTWSQLCKQFEQGGYNCMHIGMRIECFTISAVMAVNHVMLKNKIV